MRRIVSALAITALLVIGIVSLGSAQGFDRPQRGPGGPGIHAGIGFGMGKGMAQGMPMERIARHLELTDEQQQKLKDLHEVVRKEVTPLRNQAELLSVELRQLWRADELDEQKILAKSSELAAVRTKLAEIGTRFRLEMAGVLTPEQRAKMAQARHLRRGQRGDRGKRIQRGNHRAGRGMQRGMRGPEGQRGDGPPQFRDSRGGPDPCFDGPQGFDGPGNGPGPRMRGW